MAQPSPLQASNDAVGQEGRTRVVGDVDKLISRARPFFLYVMYAIILWSIPVGLIAAISPATAEAMANAMGNYLARLPEPLYALFGTGYLGYATLRQWGKTKGSDR